MSKCYCGETAFVISATQAIVDLKSMKKIAERHAAKGHLIPTIAAMREMSKLIQKKIVARSKEPWPILDQKPKRA